MCVMYIYGFVYSSTYVHRLHVHLHVLTYHFDSAFFFSNGGGARDREGIHSPPLCLEAKLHHVVAVVAVVIRPGSLMSLWVCRV